MSWPEACMLAASRLTSASAFCPDKLVNIEHHRQVMLKPIFLAPVEFRQLVGFLWACVSVSTEQLSARAGSRVHAGHRVQ